MKNKFLFRSVAGIVIAAMLSNCSGRGPFAAATPESCQINQTTTGSGALIGAGVGAVAGGLAAGLSSQRGAAAAGIVVGAAVVGALVGAVIAHEHDKACHQLALQQALDLAMARNDELQQEQEAAAQQAAEHQAAAQAANPQQRSKPSPAAAQNASEQSSKPEYMTVAWADKMTNNSGAITPIANISDSSSKQVCMTFDDTQVVNGQTKTVVGKACRGANGDWQPM